MNLNQITLPVENMEAATAFYRRLGCLHIVDTPHYARFESPQGPATFSLALDTDGPNQGVTIYFEVDDVDVTVANLQQLGFIFMTLPCDKSWLWREAELCDPSQNKIKIYHAGENRLYPPWRVKQH